MTIRIADHPLVHHKLALLRDKATPRSLFSALLEEVGLLLAMEATRGLPTESAVVETPLEPTSTQRLQAPDPVLVPILRAGLGLLPPFLRLMPTARVGCLGLYRDHTSLQPVAYYRNFPSNLEAHPVFLLDPMLATGGSAAEGIRQLKEAGAKNLTLVALLAAPEGLGRLKQDHPDLVIVVGAVDRQLNAQGYILPGLGDAGDRLFGTT